MENTKFQCTIKNDIKFEGIGLHTGKYSELIISPSPENSGYLFVKNDITFPLSKIKIEESNRQTKISYKNIKLVTIEHFLSALYGMGIDNVKIHLNSSEPPALDGSAKLIVEKIKKVGIKTQKSKKDILSFKNPIFYAEEGKSLLLLPNKNFNITYFLHYNHSLIGEQVFKSQINRNIYYKQIAPARTFALEEEISSLFSSGLAKGGSLDNAVVVYKNRYSSPLRFPDEFVRHKVLDLIGDLALLGHPISAHIIAFKTGHSDNIKFVKNIKSKISSK